MNQNEFNESQDDIKHMHIYESHHGLTADIQQQSDSKSQSSIQQHRPYQQVQPSESLYFEDSRITKLLFEQHRLIEYVRLQFLVISTALLIIQYDDNFYTEKDENNQFLWLISTFTLLLIILTYLTYVSKLNYSKAALLVPDNLTLFRSTYLTPMLIEIIVLLLHPNYFTQDIIVKFTLYKKGEYFYRLNELFTLGAILRGGILFQILLRFSTYYSSQIQRLCSVFGAEMTVTFIIKTKLKLNPMLFLLQCYGFCLFYFTFAIVITEWAVVRDEEEAFHQLLNECWNDVIYTFSVFSFGAYSPFTIPGRLVLALGMICGITLKSIFVSTLMSGIKLTYWEDQATANLLKIEVSEQIQETSTKINELLAQCLRYQANPFTYIRVKKVKELIKIIHHLKRLHRSIDRDTFEQTLKRKYKDFKSYIEEHKSTMDEMKEQQQAIHEYVKERNRKLKQRYKQWL